MTSTVTPTTTARRWAEGLRGVPARRLSRRLAGALLALVALVALAVLVAAALGVRPRVELSDSMAPVVRAGDLLWIDRIAATDATVGDVVAFRAPDRDAVVLHRVVKIDAAPGGRLAFVTKGDANTGTERWRIAAGGTIGRYAGVRVPRAGRIVLALAGAPLAAVALLSGLALAGLALRRIWS